MPRGRVRREGRVPVAAGQGSAVLSFRVAVGQGKGAGSATPLHDQERGLGRWVVAVLFLPQQED